MRRINLPFLFLAVLALLAGLWAGLLRLPWPLPPLRPTLPMAHGPLMVCGFLGTLVGLERAVGLSALGPGRRWTYAAPALTGLGGLLVDRGRAWSAGPAADHPGQRRAAGGHGQHRPHPAAAAQRGHGAGRAGLAGRQPAVAVRPRRFPRWRCGGPAFLVLTIVGERLELSRLLRLSPGKRLALPGRRGSLPGRRWRCRSVAYAPGVRLASAGMLLLAAWLLAFDMARRTVRKSGLTRFIAVGLAGRLRLAGGGGRAGPALRRRDGRPALRRLPAQHLCRLRLLHDLRPRADHPAGGDGAAVPYSPRFYVPLALLQVSLLLRVGGDLAGWLPGRRWGGLLNEVAILLFLAMLALAVRQGRKQASAG